MPERFISQPLKPVMDDIDTTSMAQGAPGLPTAFTWNQQRLDVTRVLQRWKESGDCRNGGGEQYVRKHWFEVDTQQGLRLKLYFERQARSTSQRK